MMSVFYRHFRTYGAKMVANILFKVHYFVLFNLKKLFVCKTNMQQILCVTIRILK